MMNNNYKKRGRAGWVGKKEAKDKEYRERLYAKKEISNEMKMLEQGEEFKEKTRKRKKNKIASLKYWIGRYEKRAGIAKSENYHGMFGYSWYESMLKNYKKELAELEDLFSKEFLSLKEFTSKNMSTKGQKFLQTIN